MPLAVFDHAAPSQAHASPDGCGHGIPSKTTARLRPLSQIAFVKPWAGGPAAVICFHVLPAGARKSPKSPPQPLGPPAGLGPAPPKTGRAKLRGAPPKRGLGAPEGPAPG